MSPISRHSRCDGTVCNGNNGRHHQHITNYFRSHDKESLGGGRTASEKHGRPLHLARLAVAHFDGLTGEDRTRLIEEARNGDETAQEELEAAVTAGLERVSELLADEKTRGAMCMGIGLGYADMSAGQAIDNVNPDELISVALGQCGIVIDDLEEQINSLLDFQINENEWKGAAAAEQIWSQVKLTSEGNYEHY